jgi:hypothetical protein
MLPSSVVWMDLLDVVADGVACTIQNWRRTRRYEGILSVRREGFTEDWGDRGSAAATAPEEEDDDDEADDIDDIDDDEPVQLLQYRIAWTEQLMFKIAAVPFRVVNSRYNCTEVTGALPQLRDGNFLVGGPDDIAAHLLSRLTTSGKKREKKKKKLQWPATAARDIRQGDDDNAAQQEQEHFAALAAAGDTSFMSVRQRRDAAYLTACLQNQLTPALHFYHHHADHHHDSRLEWEQVLKATHNNYCLASLQMWSERVVTTNRRLRRTMMHRPEEEEIEHVLQELRQAYQLLEDQLTESTTSYLLGTNTPTYIDCQVWGHLMEALSNRHVVATVFFFVVDDDPDNDSTSRRLDHHCHYPKLLAMARTIYTRYHFDAATGPLPEWNVEENAANAFFGYGDSDYYRRLLFGNGNRGGDYDFAQPSHQVGRHGSSDEMAMMILPQHHQQQRQQQRPAPPPPSSPLNRPNDRHDPFETWHRWRRGGPLFPAQKRRTEPVGTTSTTDAAAAVTTKFHDDVWLMSVVTATVLLVLSVGFQETNTATTATTTAQ